MSVRRPLTSARGSLSVLVCLLALLLGACAEDDPEPKIAGPATPSASPSESTIGSAQETPEEFIRRWAEAERVMLNTGETEEYAAITGPCKSCGMLAKDITDYYAAGGYVRWDGYTVRRIKPIKDGYYEVSVVGAPTDYRTSSSAKVQHLTGGKSVYRVRVVQREGQHVLADLVELAQ